MHVCHNAFGHKKAPRNLHGVDRCTTSSIVVDFLQLRYVCCCFGRLPINGLAGINEVKTWPIFAVSRCSSNILWKCGSVIWISKVPENASLSPVAALFAQYHSGEMHTQISHSMGADTIAMISQRRTWSRHMCVLACPCGICVIVFLGLSTSVLL